MRFPTNGTKSQGQKQIVEFGCLSFLLALLVDLMRTLVSGWVPFMCASDDW